MAITQDVAEQAHRTEPARRVGLDRILHDRRVREAVLQLLVLGAVVGLFGFLIANAAQALRARGIASGFGYLGQEAGFGIGETLLLDYAPSDTYLRAFLVGLINTLRVSLLSIVAATLIGLVFGLMRLSSNLGVAKLAAAYVELFRNTPQLLQIVFWYAVMTRLPGPRQALSPGADVYLSNRGLKLPWPVPHDGFTWAFAALLLGVAGAVLLTRWARRVQARTGARPAIGPWRLALILGLPLLAWAVTGAPTALERPALRGLNFTGGVTMSPEFIALFLGLALYTGAFIAEIVRSGIQSVGRGQVEAARSLGLDQGQIYRLVLLPQALRVMIPPTAGQYVSLTKSSSLAVVIGYPDLVNVSNTTLNQTGHVVEALLLMSVVYLLISFSIAAAMNLYNRAVAIKER
ncbi:amino acid ABC transporter permease [Elioraea sp.]|uniref:amino acid ABC transporter permease n=1 Tax=Elioraea sp. TaxID=2185103 RepID=UPI003F713948